MGKYHTDAFKALQEKFEKKEVRPKSVSEIASGMRDILLGYCPSHNSNSIDWCVEKIDMYANEESYGQFFKPGATKDILSDEMMDLLENAINNMDSKEETLDAIHSLKKGFDDSDEHKDAGIMALSIAAESFSLWYDVYSNENHPFHLKDNRSKRRLQFCEDFFAIVMADVDGGIAAFNNGDILGALFNSVMASLIAFFTGCPIPQIPTPPTRTPTNAPQAPSNAPSVITNPPTVSSVPSLSMVPSTDPTLSHAPSVMTHPSAAPSTLEPTAKPSSKPSISFTPTVSQPTLNNIITCISVIDESYEESVRFFANKWRRFREFYPDRPFCLLHAGIFTNEDDEDNFAYSDGIEEAESIRVPTSFFADDNAIFAFVNRDFGNENDRMDWFDLCNLEGLKAEGVGRVAFFIDESGSMTRDMVGASLELFQEKLESENVETVAAIYNDEEDWIQPFLTNFGFDGPTPTDDEVIDITNEDVFNILLFLLQIFSSTTVTIEKIDNY